MGQSEGVSQMILNKFLKENPGYKIFWSENRGNMTLRMTKDNANYEQVLTQNELFESGFNICFMLRMFLQQGKIEIEKEIVADD